MAKKKSKKQENTKTFQYNKELNGLLLILIGVIGIGTFGPVGKLIKNFAIFLNGSWYVVALVTVLLIGLYMVIKGKTPNFLSGRIIGLYFLLVAILMFSHLEYAIVNELKGKAIINSTIDNFMGATKSLNSNVGGGIIGALFVLLFTTLLDITGTKIIIGLFALFGIIMLFDVSLADLITKIKDIAANVKAKRLEKKERIIEEDDDDEEDEENDNKVIITSAEELKNYHANDENQINNNLPNFDSPIIENGSYNLPPIDLLDLPKKTKNGGMEEFISGNRVVLERALSDFGITGKVVEIHVGPSVTQFEVSVPNGTKLSRISSINRELALALAASDVRIQAPIPGKSTVGIEIPNPSISEVKIRDIIINAQKDVTKAKIAVSLGKDITGKAQIADITKTPHLLVAGSTGSGKSVCINSFLATILMKYRPDEVKLVLVDPKKVELSNYNGVPHLLCPVVTDPKKASAALQKIVIEMEKRYDVFSEAGAKNIESYNEIISKKHKYDAKKMPYIVVVVDELADLMVVAGKEVEASIQRITQMARAAGIHLIVATQRPSTDVITGVIKTNIPSRIAFKVASSIDSRTILDQSGAEKLLGKGDMLFFPMGASNPTRIQGSFITDEEIERVINYVSKEQVASYDNSLMNIEETHTAESNLETEEYDDPLYDEIVNFAAKTGKISASLLQRRFRLGYNRAARIVDLLEERGIIGPPNGSKPREVLIKFEEKQEEV